MVIQKMMLDPSFSVKRNRPDPRPRQPPSRLRRRRRKHRRHRDPAAISPPDLPLPRPATITLSMRVPAVRIVRARAHAHGYGRAVVREEGAEQEVLHHRELAEHLREVHLDHARVDLVPRLDLQSDTRGSANGAREYVRGLRTAEMSSSMGECQRSDAVFTCDARRTKREYKIDSRPQSNARDAGVRLTEFMNWMHARYM